MNRTMSSLKARSVTVSGDFKIFGLQEGKSQGSQIGITFDITEEMSPADLKKAILEEKKKIDIMCLTAEMLRGSISPEYFRSLKKSLIDNHELITKQPVHPRIDTGHQE